ncbi:hypothetical protein [uncultured Methanobrevibacter sp.]|uniref:hypothetical protein n=1 Tax=uncultured Methanobrevibacter sp. TaxID=253161 RepID=UPI00261D1E10|nr:hypothetical protein [uncultured Methanobrevibacter sp.]
MNDEELYDYLEKDLESQLGFTFNPQSHTQIEEFDYDRIVPVFYPIVEIISLNIGSTTIKPTDYILDEEQGIIYLKKHYTGLLNLKYTSGFNKNEYDTVIHPLLNLMMDYFKNNDLNKDASTVKEGDVSISYDTSISTGALIQNRINNLKKRYNTTVRLI